MSDRSRKGRKRHKLEQVIAKLRAAEVRLASGQAIAQVMRSLGVSEATTRRKT